MTKSIEPSRPAEKASPESFKTYGFVSLTFGFLAMALRYGVFQDPTFIRYFAFVGWFGSLMLFFRGWVCVSINHEKAFW